MCKTELEYSWKLLKIDFFWLLSHSHSNLAVSKLISRNLPLNAHKSICTENWPQPRAPKFVSFHLSFGAKLFVFLYVSVFPFITLMSSCRAHLFTHCEKWHIYSFSPSNIHFFPFRRWVWFETLQRTWQNGSKQIKRLHKMNEKERSDYPLYYGRSKK